MKQPTAGRSPAVQRLDELDQLVHQKVRLLKKGQSATIPIGKFTEDEVRYYLTAYALHRKKWFDVTSYDKTNRTTQVTRAEMTPWARERLDRQEEEPDEP
jgi:hypothetical protein